MRNNERLLKRAKTVHVKVRRGTLGTMEMCCERLKIIVLHFKYPGNKEKFQKVGIKL
jgi:hypothetical protein